MEAPSFISLARKRAQGERALEQRKLRIQDFLEMKKQRKKFAMISVCDYPMALLADKAGIDAILVGDALHVVALGHETTITATMDEMIMFSNAISRAAKRAFVIGDMPFMSSEVTRELAIRNAGRFLSEGLCDAVMIEGGEEMADTVKALVRAGIPVLGHIGFMPQKLTLGRLGSYPQGIDARSAEKILNDALALEKAGAFMIFLGVTAAQAAKVITKELSIPTVGTGSGPDCDGQCMISHNVLGIYDRQVGKHEKKFANLHDIILKAFEAYREEVLSGKWPDEEHSYLMNQAELPKFESMSRRIKS